MKEWAAKKYADALVSVGVNLQPGEKLVLQSDIEAKDLAREIVNKAFERGARDVEVMWTDSQTEASRAKNSTAPLLREMPEWKMEGMDSILSDGTGVQIGVSCPFPSLHEGISDENLMAQSLANNDLRNVVRKYIHKGDLKWTGTVYPTADWAKQVFPEYDENTALEMLEDAVCKMMRVDENSDPVENWKEHCRKLAERSKKLNEYNFKTLHITTELGTDLWMDLVEDHIWVSAGEMGSTNVNAPYVANMPTEEVFTDPDFRTVHGVAYASFPLYIDGKLVKDFSITFENGKAVDCSASEGIEFLKAAL
ncbi:MAG: aminopeptidase, partial [Oscillospiraceae bacterium]|nr:aminopeptidase [Oscillospiraceae bacterium]